MDVVPLTLRIFPCISAMLSRVYGCRACAGFIVLIRHAEVPTGLWRIWASTASLLLFALRANRALAGCTVPDSGALLLDIGARVTRYSLHLPDLPGCEGVGACPRRARLIG